MEKFEVICVVAKVVELLAVLTLFLSCIAGKKRLKELSNYVKQLETENNSKEEKECVDTYKNVAELNRVSKYIIENLPKVYDSYRVPMTLKKYLISYLTYFYWYDIDDFKWAADEVKNFNNCDSVSSEAKLVYKHITQGSVKKERALQAMVFLIVKAGS